MNNIIKIRRQYYFDFLRIAACFAVMVIHIDSYDWVAGKISTFDLRVLNFYRSALVRWAVPVFVMISGALFLNKDIPFKKLYSKYIFKIFTALVFWSFAYAVKDYVKTGDIHKAYETLILGHFHLWFLFMIMGLYMIVPFVRKIAESDFLTKYFLVLTIVFSSIMPHIADIVFMFSERYAFIAGKFTDKFMMYFVFGQTGYFLLGYFLDNKDITQKAERMIYFAGLCGFAFTTTFPDYAQNMKTAGLNLLWRNGLDTICVSAAVFIFFRKHFNYENRFIMKLAKYSFGTYLIHFAVITALRQLGLFSMAIRPAFLLPVIAVAVFIVSFIISAILNHIPLLKKYIV